MKHWILQCFYPLWLCLLVGCTTFSATEPPKSVQLDPFIELMSKYELPVPRVLSAIKDGSLRPETATEIRASLNRLWALGIFGNIRVTEVNRAGGLVLQYHLTVRPYVRSLNWKGNPGLDEAQLAAVANIPVGGSAEPEPLEQARKALLARYQREGFFEATVGIDNRADPATNARDITFILDAGVQFRVGKIELAGAERVSEEVLIKAFTGKRRFIPIEFITGPFGQRTGRPYQEGAVKDGVRAVRSKLGEEGFFEARVTLQKTQVDAADDQVNLRIEVVEGPRYRVEFSGNENLSDSLLNEQLVFADAGIVDEAEIGANVRVLESSYKEKGYHFVRIEGALERPHKDASEGIIRFRIVEGPRVIVESVTFKGNAHFAPGLLLSSINTGPPGVLGTRFFGSGVFRQQLLDADLGSLEAFYRSRGYAKAKIGPPEVNFTEDRRRVRITVPIVEGPRFTVGQVQTRGATLLAAADIKQAVPLVAGEPWIPSRLQQGRSGLLRLYTRKGYLQARVKAESREEGDRVNVTYTVSEGKETRVGRVLLQGLLLTREEAVMRELDFKEGEPFDPEKLSKAQRRLASLPQFESVQVVSKQASLDPRVSDVEVKVREGKPWRLDFGLGYNTEVGAGGFVEVGHDNLFGTRRSISFRQQLNQRGLLSDLALRDPHVLDTDWEGEVGLRFERQEPQNVGFKLEELEFRVSVRKGLFEDRIRGLSGDLTYRLDRVRRFDVDPSLAADDIKEGTEIVASLTPSLTLDRRDSKINPTKGSLHFASLETAGTVFGSDASFMKFRFESHWLFQLLPPTVFALSGRLGLATPFGSAIELPIEDRFFAGGSTTIRGYLKNKVGPLNSKGDALGGDALLIFNAEWRFPIWKVVGGTLFVDTGTVTNTVNDLFDSGFKTGVGGGLRLLTPVGPVRLDLGYALNPIRQDSRWQVYFSVGNPF